MGKICSDCAQEFSEWVSKRGGGKEGKGKGTIKVAQMTVIKEMGENSGKKESKMYYLLI